MENSSNQSGINFVPRLAKGLNVLVVDRDQNALILIFSMLKRNSFNVSTTTLALKALELIHNRENNVQLVIADIDTTGMDYFSFVCAINGSVPLIMMSKGKANKVTRALDGGLPFSLEKPFGMKELGAILHRIDWEKVMRECNGNNPVRIKTESTTTEEKFFQRPRSGSIIIREPGNNTNNRVGTAPKYVEKNVNGKAIIIIDDDDEFEVEDTPLQLKRRRANDQEEEGVHETRFRPNNQQSHLNFEDHQHDNTSVQDLVQASHFQPQENLQDPNRTVVREYLPYTAVQSSGNLNSMSQPYQPPGLHIDLFAYPNNDIPFCTVDNFHNLDLGFRGSGSGSSVHLPAEMNSQWSSIPLWKNSNDNNVLVQDRRIDAQRVDQFVPHLLADEFNESNSFAFERTLEGVGKYCEWLKENPDGKSVVTAEVL